MSVKFYSTQRKAERAKRRLKGTKRTKWIVQGNAVVQVPRR